MQIGSFFLAKGEFLNLRSTLRTTLDNISFNNESLFKNQFDGLLYLLEVVPSISSSHGCAWSAILDGEALTGDS